MRKRLGISLSVFVQEQGYIGPLLSLFPMAYIFKASKHSEATGTSYYGHPYTKEKQALNYINLEQLCSEQPLSYRSHLKWH